MSKDIHLYNKIDLNNIRDSPPYRVGRLTNDMINLLDLNINEKDIFIWKDRLKYIEKHKIDFKSNEQYNYCISRIPEIIQSPEYIGIHPSSNSIEFIKKVDALMIVAVRLKTKASRLNVRSAYPLTNEQFQDYLESNTIHKV